MSATEEDMVADVEVVIRYYSCRHCDIRFGSLEDMTEHLREEHHTNASQIVKEEIEDESVPLETEDYVVIEERQLLSEMTDNQQLFQQLATQEPGQFVLQFIQNENENAEGEENGEQQVEDVAGKAPKTKRTPRKRKAVDKEYYPSPQTRLTRKNIKLDVSDQPQVLHLLDGPANQAAEMDEDAVGVSRADPDSEDYDGDFPNEYTPSYKAKKARITDAPMDESPLRKFPCPFQGCNYIAKYRSNLWDHKKTHTGEKPYVCTWPSCSMKFSQTHQLKLHLRSHTGERPYVCDWPGCNSAFSQKPGLKSHMLTHTGEKPYRCDYPGCTWTFRLKGALTDHKRAIHENAKRHICSWPGCNKRFLQHCHLKKHVMGHADIKPFSCDWPSCNYKAVTMAYVSNHRKTHTGEKNYECTYPNCNKRFVKSSHVNRHRTRCHPDLYAVITDPTDEDDYETTEEGEILKEEILEEEILEEEDDHARSKSYASPHKL